MVSVSQNRTNVQPAVIVIIGLGPRGLSILERLLAVASTIATPLRIVIFEPGELGTGLHFVDQPDYLVLNTIACQLTAFPDRASLNGGPERNGPSLFEWCKMMCVRNTHAPAASESVSVEASDFLPRNVLGRYLSWAYTQLIEQAPRNIAIEVFRENAVRIEQASRAGPYRVVGDKQSEALADKVFITIGHATATKKSNIRQPRTATFSRVPDHAVVEIQGLGLSAMDALASLTLGKSGSFERDMSGQLVYEPSGREPQITLFSRSGLPFLARPEGLAEHRRHRPALFTEARIAAIRQTEGENALDFEQHIRPLLEAEMVLAYYEASGESVGAAFELRETLQSLSASVRDEEALLAERMAIASLASRYGRFDPESYLLTSIPDELTGEAYQDWVMSYLQDDLNESRLGLPASARKCALEVWRDLREVIRQAVNFDGLTASSRANFYSVISPMINRLVAGPHIQRQEEFLALLRSGVVRLLRASDISSERARRITTAFSESDREEISRQGYLIEAQVSRLDADSHQSPLAATLIEEGLLTPAEQVPFGVKVDKHGHPITAAGTVLQDVWVFGPLAEGSTYYNHYVSSPGGYSRAIHEANSAALECVADLALSVAA